MRINNNKFKYLFTGLLSLVVVSCGFQKKNNTEKFDGTNFVRVNSNNANEHSDISSEIRNNKVIKFELEHNSKNLDALYKDASPLLLHKKNVYLFQEPNGELNIVATDNNSKHTESEIGKMILQKVSVPNEAETENQNTEPKNENKLDLKRSSVTVSLFEEELQCHMPDLDEKDTKLVDYCNKQANVKLHFKVDMTGSRKGEFSTKNSNEKIKTEEGKFITFSISPLEEGGTGWHIGDTITQKQTKKGDKISTIANKYMFEIDLKTVNPLKKEDVVVDLIHTFPLNINPKTNVSETRGYNFGLSGGLKSGVKGEFKPAVSPATGLSLGEVEANLNAELSANVLHTNSRTIQFETHEYTVENNSNANKAMWIWDAKIPENICTYLTNYDSYNCNFSTLPWNTKWTSNINKFSAISHKSFTPAFQAIYKTSKENKGTSDFYIWTKAQTAVVYGNVTNYVVKKSYNISVGTGEIQVAPVTVTVNWSSPFFASEENVRLQKMKDLTATLCLASAKDSNQVSLADCNNSHEQIWGYDIETKQLKSRSGLNNLCLALKKNNFLGSEEYIAITEPCSEHNEDKVIKNNQIWELTSEGYIKSKEDPEGRVLDLNASNELVLKAPSKSSPQFKAYDAKL